jgi:peptidase A4-like protein
MLAAAASAVMLALGAAGTAAASPGTSPAGHGTRVTLPPFSRGAVTRGGITRSQFYAGYVDLPDQGASFYQYVTASFTVPTLNCSVTPSSEVTQIIGFGGWTYGEPSEVGLYSNCSGGVASYEGVTWYQYGGNTYESDVLSVNPGDTITGSVFVPIDGDDGTFKLVDSTQGTYSETQHYVYDELDAEVLTGGNLNSDGTADFGSVSFSQVKVTGSSGHATWLNGAHFKTLHVIEKGPVTGKADVEPTPITDTAHPAASAFSDNWYRTN